MPLKRLAEVKARLLIAAPTAFGVSLDVKRMRHYSCGTVQPANHVSVLKMSANKSNYSAMFCFAIVRTNRWTSGWDN